MTLRKSMTLPRIKAGAWLALFALWFQALLPLAHHPAAMDMAIGPATFSISGNLCLAPGAMPVDPSDKAPAHKPPPCPICQTFQMLHGGFVPPSPTLLVLPEPYRLTAAVPPNADRTEQYIHFGARARAPPMRA